MAIMELAANATARYCTEMNVGEWKSTIESLGRETTMDFFLHVCETSKIESWGTSKVYIRQFQQLYTSVTGRYMDRNDSKELYKVHPRLALLGLDTEYLLTCC